MKHTLREYLHSLQAVTRRNVAISSLVFALLVLMAMMLFKSDTEPVVLKEKARRVSTMAVKTAKLSPSLPLYVRVTTPNRAGLRASVTADVSELNVLEGGAVQQGQVLVRLDDKETLLEVEQHRAELADIDAQINSEKQRHANDQQALKNERQLLELAKKSEARARNLVKNNLGSESSIDNALADVEQRDLAVRNRSYAINEHTNRLARLQAQHARSSALLKRAELDLARTVIRAPFNGRVAKLHVGVGDRVQPGESIIDVFDTASIELRGTLANRYIEVIQMSLQQDHQILANAVVDGVQIEAKLTRLAAEVSSISGGVDALFIVTGGASALQLGRSLQLFLQLPPVEPVVAIPVTALYGSSQVYKIVNDRMKAVSVKRLGDYRSGTMQHPQILVQSPDLQDEDVIVTTQLPNAVENLLVEIVKAE